MKIAVFSDSHGAIRKMQQACRALAPDMAVHLGDFERDASWLTVAVPALPVKALRGNCDFASGAPESDTLFVDGLKIFLCHGHLYRVKQGLENLTMAAGVAGADIVMFGHTHQPLVTTKSGVTLINPGSAGEGRRQTCALLDTVSREVRIVDLDTFS